MKITDKIEFFCEVCNTNIGCSYYNFAVECEKEIKFKKEKEMELILKIENKIKELEETKKIVEKSNFFNINKALELRIIQRCIDELNSLI